MNFNSIFNPEALKEIAAILADSTKNGQHVKAETFLENNGLLTDLPIAREKLRRGPDKSGGERDNSDIEKSLISNRVSVFQTIAREGLLDNLVDGVSFTHFLGKNGGIGQMTVQSKDSKEKKSSDRKLDPAFVEKLKATLAEHLPEGVNKILTRNEIATLMGATISNVAKMETDISAALNNVPELVELYARKPGVGGGTCLKSTLLLLAAEKSKKDKKISDEKSNTSNEVTDKPSASVEDASSSETLDDEKVSS